MASFGHTGSGVTQSTPVNGDTKFALKSVAPESGVVTAIFVDMQNSGSEVQAFRAGIYNDSTTLANATLVDQSDVVLISPGATRAFVSFNSGINAAITAGNAYWLVLHAGTTGGNASFWYDAGVGNEAIGTDSFTDGLASSFGVNTPLANSLAIYANYTPVSLAVSGLKRVSLGRVRAGV